MSLDEFRDMVNQPEATQEEMDEFLDGYNEWLDERIDDGI